MSRTDLRADVGQLVIMGFIPAEMTPALRVVLRAIRPGGVILFARNITAAAQTWELLDECRRAVAAGNGRNGIGRTKSAAKTEPMFLCVDLEGGTVDRLKNVIAPAPSAAEVFASGDRKLFRRHGRLLGEESRALGFNTDFAPVFDLAFPPALPVLTTRVVSADPHFAIGYARELLRGLHDARVL